MAIALDASTPAAVYNDTNNTTTAVTTASFTPPSGSVVLGFAFTDDQASLTVSSITGSALTFTSRATSQTASHAPVVIYSAIGAGAATTVSANFSGTGSGRGLIVLVFTGAQLAATPATHTLAAGSAGAPSDSVTTVGTNSVVAWINADWAAINGSTRTYRSSATEAAYHFLSTQATTYVAYQAAAAAGAQTYGLTAPTGQTYNLAAIEVQASGAANFSRPIQRRPQSGLIMRGRR